MILEASVAILFLLPGRFRITRWRDYSLHLFAVSLYSLVSVTGFAWILMVMGFTQATGKTTRRIYVFLAVLIVVLRFARKNLIYELF